MTDEIADAQEVQPQSGVEQQVGDPPTKEQMQPVESEKVPAASQGKNPGAIIMQPQVIAEDSKEKKKEEVQKNEEEPAAEVLTSVPTASATVPSHSQLRTFKVVVLGKNGVGKSALTMRFASGQFVNDYDPTIEDTYTKQVADNETGEMAVLQVLDTAGNEEFASMHDSHTREAQIFLFVFALDSRESFEECKREMERVQQMADCSLADSQEHVCLLVANKCELSSNERVVDEADGRQLAAEMLGDENLYFEVSAKSGVNVDELFQMAVKLKYRKEPLLHSAGLSHSGSAPMSACCGCNCLIL